MIGLLFATALAAELSLGAVEVAGKLGTPSANAMRARLEAALAEGDVELGAGAPLVLDAALAGVERRNQAPTGLEVRVRFVVRAAADGHPLYALDARGYLPTDQWNADAPTSPAIDAAVESLLTHPRFTALLAAPPTRAAAARPDAEARLARCTPAKLALPGDIPRVIDAVVVVSQGDSVGTGFQVSPDGWVATAAHVVDGTGPVKLRTRAGLEVVAQVVRFDQRQDVALLHATGLSGACVALEAATPDLGAELFIVGTPAGLDYSVSKGIVSSVRTVGDTRLVQTDAPISPGSSGGPVLDGAGRVRGLVRAKLAGDGLEGLGFATPVETFLGTLRVSMAERSDDPAAVQWKAREEVSADIVDTADPSRLGEIAKKVAKGKATAGTRTAGIVLAAAGLAAAGGTWLWADNAEYAGDAAWGGMTVLNTTGWLAVGGGAALLGVSFLPTPTGSVAVVSTRF